MTVVVEKKVQAESRRDYCIRFGPGRGSRTGMESGKIELGAGSFAQSDSVATRIPFRVQTLQPEAEELPTALESLDGWSWQLGITDWDTRHRTRLGILLVDSLCTYAWYGLPTTVRP